MADPPHYDLNEFINACTTTRNVEIWPDARKNAKDNFHLSTKNHILDFISNNGLESIKFIAQEPMRLKGPLQNQPVDSYEFTTGRKIGCLAILKNPNGNLWLIKSFKLHHKMNIGAPMESPQAREALKSLGLSRRVLQQRNNDHGEQ